MLKLLDDRCPCPLAAGVERLEHRIFTREITNVRF